MSFPLIKAHFYFQWKNIFESYGYCWIMAVSGFVGQAQSI